LTLFADAPPAQAAAAEVTLGPCKRSRTIVLVDLSEQDSYAVTLERVLGGSEHTCSFHGPDGPAVPIGLNLTPQQGGTVLGPDVEYGDYASKPAADRDLACLAFLYDVRRARPAGPWSLDYRPRDQKNLHLRVTMIHPEGCELAVAKGKPTQGNKAYEMIWTILRRSGKEPLASEFLTVLEPFEGRRLVRTIEPLALRGRAPGPSRPIGVRITSDKYVDTIILQADAPVQLTTDDGIAFAGRFGFWRHADGKLVRRIVVGEGAYRGRVVRCDWTKRHIWISPRPADVESLVGRHIRFTNAAGSSASYLVRKAAATRDGCRITLSLDPRIGEGFVQQCRDGQIVSDTKLGFSRYWRYYAGKTITNEAGTEVYRLQDVFNSHYCMLDEASHGKVAQATLARQFIDSNGDDRPRFIIYDYGPRDDVTILNRAVGP